MSLLLKELSFSLTSFCASHGTERVSTQVVVVRELFSLVTSAVCVRIRGHRSEVTKIVYHMARVFIYYSVLTTVDS